MASCEKCWRDAYDPHMRITDADRYRDLVASRDCTPEEQAGRDATFCGGCRRTTVHQYAHVCMACGALADEESREGKE